MKEVDLQLYEPERGRPERGSKLAQMKRFNAWLESLPLGNMTAAGNKLLAALKEMNQTELSARQRAEMLDRAVAPVLTVVEVLDRHFRETSFPLDEKKDRVGRVAVEFFSELSLGYRIAAHALAGEKGSIGFLHKRSVARCLHHALAAMEQMMYRLALQYREAPPQSWRQISTIYVFARQNDLHERSFETALSLGTDDSTDQVFKRILLMGISDPSRLNQRSIRALVRAVRPWSKRCRLLTDRQIDAAEPGLFSIDAQGDDPPLLITEEEAGRRFALVFDVTDLRQWLEEHQETANEGEEGLSFEDTDGNALIIDRDLIRQLLATWGIRRERSFQRLPAQHEVRLLVGLNAVHFSAAGDNPFSRFIREFGDKSFSAAAVRGRTGFSGRTEMVNRPTIYRGGVLNQSLGGYRLRISQVENLQMRVGELVSVCPKVIADVDAVWMIGIVRWLHAIDVRELEIGVSIVGQDARPAAVLEDDSRSIPTRGLICEPFKRIGGESEEFLLLAGIWHPGGGPIALCAAGKEGVGVGDDYCGPIEIRERLERTSEIARYRFERTGVQAAPE